MDEADILVLEYLGEEPNSGIPGLRATAVVPNEHSQKQIPQVPKVEKVATKPKPSPRLQKLIAKYSGNAKPSSPIESGTVRGLDK